jgi:hypothetical protein
VLPGLDFQGRFPQLSEGIDELTGDFDVREKGDVEFDGHAPDEVFVAKLGVLVFLGMLMIRSSLRSRM